MSRRTLLPLVAVAALAGCGGDDPPSASTTPARGGGGPMAAAFDDPKVAACLKKQGGVELPQRPRDAGARTQPQGPPPEGGQRPRRDNAQFEKLRKALEQCGVELPQPGQQPPPQT